jgi:sulfatase modifying factor 1
LLPAWSALAQETLTAQSIRFRLIPGGWYFIGSPPNETGRYADEASSHKVNLKPFYISVTEITNAQYGRFLKATGYKVPLYWQDKTLNAPNQPVVGVTWFDAVAFCRWLTKTAGVACTLPTEAQWEAAARGGLVGQPYPWGSQAPAAGGVYRANFHSDLPGATGFRFTAPVGSFPANGYGLFDMAGNVSEWCQDRYVPLRTGGPFKPGILGLLKGGSFISGPRDLRVAARQSAPPSYADGYIGFRVVRPAQP